MLGAWPLHVWHRPGLRGAAVAPGSSSVLQTPAPPSRPAACGLPSVHRPNLCPTWVGLTPALGPPWGRPLSHPLPPRPLRGGVGWSSGTPPPSPSGGGREALLQTVVGGGRTPRRDTRLWQFRGAAGQRALASSRVPYGCCEDEMPSLRRAFAPGDWEGPEGRTPFGIHPPAGSPPQASKDPALPGPFLPEGRGHQMAPPPRGPPLLDPSSPDLFPRDPLPRGQHPPPRPVSPWGSLSSRSICGLPHLTAPFPPVRVLRALRRSFTPLPGPAAATSNTPDILTPI